MAPVVCRLTMGVAILPLLACVGAGPVQPSVLGPKDAAIESAGQLPADTGTPQGDGSLCTGSACACTEAVQCPGVHATCIAGKCGVATSCNSDKVCGSKSQLCDKAQGVCVDCLSDSDCVSPAQCKAHQCAAPGKACASSKDCGSAAVCASGSKQCVLCETTADCTSGGVCIDTLCVPPVCQAGVQQCVDGVLKHCAADGSAVTVTACAGGCAGNACAAVDAPDAASTDGEQDAGTEKDSPVVDVADVNLPETGPADVPKDTGPDLAQPDQTTVPDAPPPDVAPPVSGACATGKELWTLTLPCVMPTHVAAALAPGDGLLVSADCAVGASTYWPSWFRIDAAGQLLWSLGGPGTVFVVPSSTQALTYVEGLGWAAKGGVGSTDQMRVLVSDAGKVLTSKANIAGTSAFVQVGDTLHSLYRSNGNLNFSVVSADVASAIEAKWLSTPVSSPTAVQVLESPFGVLFAIVEPTEMMRMNPQGAISWTTTVKPKGPTVTSLLRTGKPLASGELVVAFSLSGDALMPYGTAALGRLDTFGTVRWSTNFFESPVLWLNIGDIAVDAVGGTRALVQVHQNSAVVAPKVYVTGWTPWLSNDFKRQVPNLTTYQGSYLYTMDWRIIAAKQGLYLTLITQGPPKYSLTVAKVSAFGHADCSSAGKCATLPLSACDDGNPCTSDDCDADAGCVHKPMPITARCGDPGQCDGAGSCVQPSCGNGNCEVGESNASCSKDCPATVCGDAKCAPGEAAKCPADCPGCIVANTSGCQGCACGPCVCGMLPACCSGEWTSQCAALCKVCAPGLCLP